MQYNKKHLAGTIAGTFIVTTLFYQGMGWMTLPFQSINYNAKLNEVTNVINSLYLHPLDKSKLVDNAALGVAATAEDPYTAYYSKEDYKKLQESLTGEYSGVGLMVSVDKKTDEIVVIEPFEGAPANRAGIQAGDRIYKVEGKDTPGSQLEEAVRLMKGLEGTEVTVSIMREGYKEPKDYKLTRQKIHVPSVKHSVMANGLGYLRIISFDEEVSAQFELALNDLLSKKVKGVVLDLRDNPGGAVREVVRIADSLLPEGNIMYTEDKKGEKKYQTSDEKMIDIPMVVLVNEASASASEILSGALKDYGRATIIGKKTFGKGLVQQIVPLKDGSAVKVTIQQYFTPKGNEVNKKGIQPDVEVSLPEGLNKSISQLTIKEDTQLQKAVDVLQTQIKK